MESLSLQQAELQMGKESTIRRVKEATKKLLTERRECSESGSGCSILNYCGDVISKLANSL